MKNRVYRNEIVLYARLFYMAPMCFGVCDPYRSLHQLLHHNRVKGHGFKGRFVEATQIMKSKIFLYYKALLALVEIHGNRKNRHTSTDT